MAKMNYDGKKLAMKWWFEGHCALCGIQLHQEVHHCRNPLHRGEEKPGDIIPLCTLCHAFVTWRLSGALEPYLAEGRQLMSQQRRVRIRVEQIAEWAEKYLRTIRSLLAEADWNLQYIEAMEDAWNEWKGLPKKFGLDALQEADDREERDTWGDERRAA